MGVTVMVICVFEAEIYCRFRNELRDRRIPDEAERRAELDGKIYVRRTGTGVFEADVFCGVGVMMLAGATPGSPFAVASEAPPPHPLKGMRLSSTAKIPVA